MTEPIFLNSSQIAEALNIPAREIWRYVKNHNMPAFKESEKGKWKARKDTLLLWAIEHEKKFIKFP